MPKSCENVVVSCGVMWMRSGQKRRVSKNCFQTCGYATWSKIGCGFFVKKCFFFFFCFFCPPKNGRSSGKPPFPPPSFFCTRCKTAIPGPLYYSLCNLFSSTLLHKPCSPEFALKRSFHSALHKNNFARVGHLFPHSAHLFAFFPHQRNEKRYVI